MKKYRALVVEDDEDLGLIFSTALRSLNFEDVELIADGAKALAWLAEHEPDLVVLDLHLPKLSGVNLLRQITAELRLLNTRVMIVTADTGMAEELRNRADLVLVKPITFTQIRDLASRLVPGAGVAESPSQMLAARPETALSATPVSDARTPADPAAPASVTSTATEPGNQTLTSPPSEPPQQTQPPAASPPPAAAEQPPSTPGPDEKDKNPPTTQA